MDGGCHDFLYLFHSASATLMISHLLWIINRDDNDLPGTCGLEQLHFWRNYLCRDT